MGELIFGGISSKEIGLEVEHFPDFEIPERDYTVTHVPGRNGDVIWDNGSYKNVSRKYDISIGRFGMGGHEHVTGSYESETGSEIYSGLTEHYQSIFHLLDRDSYIGSKIKIAFILNKTTNISVKINNDERTITTFISVEQDIKTEESIDVSSYGIDNITDISIAIEPHADEGSVTMTLYSIIVMSVKDTYEQMAIHVLNWLHQGSGYLRLEDSYEPSYYRLASYKENVDISNILAQGGKATITFDCKPQRFLKEPIEWPITKTFKEGTFSEILFKENYYSYNPICRFTIYPSPNGIKVDSMTIYLLHSQARTSSFGTITFVGLEDHLEETASTLASLIIDFDLFYEKVVGVYKYSNEGELIDYPDYEPYNVISSTRIAENVRSNNCLYFYAIAFSQDLDPDEEPYEDGEDMVNIKANLRRFLI